MSAGLILFVLLIAMPIAEVATFIQIGGWLGLWPTIALVIATAAAGTAIIRMQGLGLLRSMQQQVDHGALPAFELFSGACLLVAGALLLTPGFITDGIGFVLLWPWARALLFRHAERHVHVVHAKQPFKGHHRAGQNARRGPHPPPRSDDVIDVEFEEIESGDMPPMGRGWGGADNGNRGGEGRNRSAGEDDERR